MSKKKLFTGISVLICILFLANIVFGSVDIPLKSIAGILSGRFEGKDSWRYIILESRIPQAVTAMLAGAALAVSGLMLQVLFRNPLADPSILGISGGANLGVAFVLLYFGANIGGFSLLGGISVILAAIAGSLAILGIIVWFAEKVGNNVILLIIGLVIAYLTSSFITILNSIASKDSVYTYIMWGMGSFGNVSSSMLPLYSLVLISVLGISLLMVKSLNLLQIGEDYAFNLGLGIKKTRNLVIILAGTLTAVVTAFCGPVSFIGLMVPHVSFLLYGNSDQRVLLPLSILCGAALALLCNLFSIVPIGGNMIPINAITPLLGTPVVIYVILNRKIY